MKVVKTRLSDKENSTKYLFKVEDEEVGHGYIFNREVNPIEVYIDKQFQSNGYGKKLFKVLLKEIKDKGIKGIIFSISNEQQRFANIISQAGAVEVSRNGKITEYVLKIV